MEINNDAEAQKALDTLKEYILHAEKQFKRGNYNESLGYFYTIKVDCDPIIRYLKTKEAPF